MKVAFLLYNLQGGGSERMATRVAEGYVKRGIDTSIIVFDGIKCAYDIPRNVKLYDLHMGGKKSLLKNIKSVKALRKCLKDNDIDLLYAYYVIMLPFAILARNRKTTKVIGAERANPKALKWVYRIIIKIFSPMCDGYLFQTEGARNCYPKSVQKKSVVIGNIVPQVHECKELRPGKDSHAVCTAGRLHIDKDYPTLLKAFRTVVKEIPDATLHIYGEGPQEQELKTLSKSLEMENNIVFEGFVQDMGRELQKYKYFVLSSKAEGLPNVLMEAMSLGLACISTDCDFGPRQVISNEKNGILVPVEDSEAMAKALVRVMDDNILSERIVGEAQKTMLNYSEDKIVSQYIKYVNCVFFGSFH